MGPIVVKGGQVIDASLEWEPRLALSLSLSQALVILPWDWTQGFCGSVIQWAMYLSTEPMSQLWLTKGKFKFIK